MPRKGRQAELILNELEKFSLGDIAEIKSPDYLFDWATQENREVDISIKCKVGSHEFLTVIECRDRKAKQDVTWIEQIISKTQHIKANRIIAVSTSGFTEGATKLAEISNIILRTLKNFKASEAVEWLDSFKLCIRLKTCNVKSTYIEIIKPELKNKSKGKQKDIEFVLNPYEKKFIVSKTGDRVSLNDIISYANNDSNNCIFEGLKDGDTPVIRKIKLQFVEENKYFYEFESEKYIVDFFDLELECWVEEKIVSFSNAQRYEEDLEPIIDKVNYDFQTEDKKLFFEVFKNYKDGRTIMQVNFIDLYKDRT